MVPPKITSIWEIRKLLLVDPEQDALMVCFPGQHVVRLAVDVGSVGLGELLGQSGQAVGVGEKELRNAALNK
jgi:hypothetical protein